MYLHRILTIKITNKQQFENSTVSNKQKWKTTVALHDSSEFWCLKLNDELIYHAHSFIEISL